ncbi:MAG: DUF2189 domain-containing protein [Gammaproteobacteria bacterium]|nr:DUF2189 domain-containing protein [Gammaproteobacteria bacterium]
MHDANPDVDPLPFVAPCHVVKLSAPLQWLKLGIADARQAPVASLGYGIIMATLIMAVVAMAWNFGSAWIMFSMLCGFVFLAPLTCIGTYAISAQLERNMPVSFKATLKACFKPYISNQLVFTLVLLIIFLVWARASSMISIFLPNTGDYALTEMAGYFAVLLVTALVFLSITFSASVFSLPMMMHRDVDAITAVLTSVNAVLRNKRVMFFWGLLITLGMIVGILSAGLGLIIFLPVVGHAVWHGYLETIDASAFPRHRVGITATARTAKQLNRSE